MSDRRKPVLKKDVFLRRAKRLYQDWNENKNGFDKIDAFYVVVGTDDEGGAYTKSASFQSWLYAMEMPDTLMVATRNGMFILASAKKADFFNSITGDDEHDGVPKITTIHRNKEDKDSENFARLVKEIENAGGKLGCFVKDKYNNEFCAAWNKAISAFQKVDIGPAFAHLFCSKDDDEITLTKEASLASANTWSTLKKKFVEFIDGDRKVSHAKVASLIETLSKSVEVQGSLSRRAIEQAYPPIVQSGGTYAFKWSTESNAKPLSYVCIMCSFGCRLENYCSNLTRTLMIDPTKDMEETYEQILLAQNAVIQALKPGNKLSDAYNAGLNFIKENAPHLVDKLYTKEFGFVTGLEFREPLMVISPKCDAEVKAGMTFIVQLSVTDIKSKDATRPAAISIGDTVLISTEGPPIILTEKARSRLKAVSVRIKEEEDENEAPMEDLGRGKRSVVLTDHTRNKQTNEDKRKARQKELAEILNKNARERMEMHTDESVEKKIKKSNIAYKNYEKFPVDEEIDNLRIHVDRRHEAVIFPIFGIPVPFHISMIKNISQSVEGDLMYLRINFNHPGSNLGKENIQFPNPLATYLKELTFRASVVKDHTEAAPPSHNLSNAFRIIKELQKKFRTEEAEEREKEGTIKQDKLVINANRVNPKLKDLYVRPNIIAKRLSGSLEAHTNGFRYTSQRGDKIDVLFNNIKHAFFQPCNNEMIILLHFHLKNPVLWGKKKYSDVQFFTEVGEITTDLGKFHHMQDRDDIASEQMEREMRRKLNQTFQAFCDKVQRQTNDAIDFESPFNELSFLGVPFRSSCSVKPTSTCLVNLTEWPPFVVTLSEIELVHFERVSFSLKNFDMVFIFKDYRRKTQMIQQIPMTSLDLIKDWLNNCDIKYTEGLQSLNWPKIMKTIVDDPRGFFQDGGWSFLDNESDEEKPEEDDSDSSEAYDPSEDDNSEEDSDEDEEDSDGSGEPTEDESSGSEASLDSDESEGKDWSDLEEEARKADKRREVEEAEGNRKHGHSHKHNSSHKNDRRPLPSPSKKRKPDDRRGPPMKKRK